MNITRRESFRLLAAASLVFSDAVRGAAAGAGSPTLIDTHTHFYDPTRPQKVPWPDPGDSLLYRKVLPADYRKLAEPYGVTGTVVVEASPWLEDNQWILDLAEREPWIVGFVGNLAIDGDDFAAQLGRFAKNRLFRGIRIGGGRLKERLGRSEVKENLRRLAGAGLSLDLLGGPEMLSEIPDLVREVPDLRIVIDHVANLKIEGAPPGAVWRDGMQGLAAHRNVYCKVSGLVEGTSRSKGDAPNDLNFYRPVLDVVWKAFGEDRVIYGSNWPVSERFASYGTVQTIVQEYFREKGGPIRDKFFFKNAKTAYRWVDRR